MKSESCRAEKKKHPHFPITLAYRKCNECFFEKKSQCRKTQKKTPQLCKTFLKPTTFMKVFGSEKAFGELEGSPFELSALSDENNFVFFSMFRVKEKRFSSILVNVISEVNCVTREEAEARILSHSMFPLIPSRKKHYLKF